MAGPNKSGTKNLPSEILDAITSDSTQFKGANIDAPISNAGIDPDIVRYKSRTQGATQQFGFTQPDSVSTTVTGGGIVDFTHARGVEISPGTTSGDRASLEWGKLNSTYFSKGVLQFTIIMHGQYSAIADEMEVGLVESSTGASKGAYYDIASDQYNVAGTTAPAPNFEGRDTALLRITIDNVNGETTFELFSGNGAGSSIDDTTTIASTPAIPSSSICTTTSNGNGDTLYIKAANWIYTKT